MVPLPYEWRTAGTEGVSGGAFCGLKETAGTLQSAACVAAACVAAGVFKAVTVWATVGVGPDRTRGDGQKHEHAEHADWISTARLQALSRNLLWLAPLARRWLPPPVAPCSAAALPCQAVAHPVCPALPSACAPSVPCHAKRVRTQCALPCPCVRTQCALPCQAVAHPVCPALPSECPAWS
eukprot:350893-Chlamydomonas_euryale.AAC.4